MRRLAALDWLLIGTFIPILLFGVVMTVVDGVRYGFVLPPFRVSSAPDEQSYPVVGNVWVPAVPVAAGDRVVSVEGVSLRGKTAGTSIMRWGEAARRSRVVRFIIERGASQSEVQVPPAPNIVPWWAPLPFALSLAGVVLFLLVRAAHWHLARRFYVASMLFAFSALHYFLQPSANPWFMVTAVLVMPLAYGLTVWNAFDFVPAARPLRPWQIVLPWLLAVWASAAKISALWLPDVGVAAILSRSRPIVGIGFVVALLLGCTEAYRRSDPIGRRQVKWVVYGFYVGTLPYAMFWVVWFLAPAWADYVELVSVVAAVAIPLGFLVSVAFYQLFDIDRLIGASLSYGLLAVLGVALLFVLVPTASRAASEALGVEPTTGQILLSLALAGVLVPAQRAVRPRIDRLLFAERVALQRGFDQLLGDIDRCGDIDELATLVGERLDVLLRPASAVLYARNGDLFTPLRVRGRAAPPAFAAHSALVAALAEHATPLAAERWTERRSTVLGPFDRAALETLDVAVLLPVRRGTDLIAFSCLGPKRSGDIYTPTDLTLLGAVLAKISDRLRSIDTTAIAEQARAMQDALRRYVPGAVAQRIIGGLDLDAGEREVTVLFVDIRGYTGFSEPRRAEEIFTTVNRYTETVSRLVQARGGAVVEFHGDGMLVVFGAPDEIASKERAAVEAAREVVAAIAALPAPNGGAAPALSVGVGIATGPAFVGNIESTDRLIWTVIGNTVNLAARLQSLTRELNAAIAIDDTTFQRARAVCANFSHRPDIAIRGRTQRETIHALPLG